MPVFMPFAALRPSQDSAAAVIGPPYDVISRAEAASLVQDKPWHMLRVSRAEINFPDDVDPYESRVYEKAAAQFQAMINADVLQRDTQPSYYFYRLESGTHVQTGIAGVVAIDEYRQNIVRRHELTRPNKEDDRTHHIDQLNAQTGPVFLVHPKRERLNEIAHKACAAPPSLEATGMDGVSHKIWQVHIKDICDEINAIFSEMKCLYIADGHHRAAAAARVSEARRKEGVPNRAPQDFLFTVSFPDDEVRILDYNRVVKDLNGLTVAEFLEKLRGSFTVEQQDQSVRPKASGEFGLYTDGHWYRLTIKSGLIPEDPVRRLDVSLLTAEVLTPILGIQDLRRDARIDFVGGARGLRELQRLVDTGEMAAAFALYPTPLVDLMRVADAGEVMPPKSTWFEPKLADGLLSYPLS